MTWSASWLFWALLSAIFAALTAIFAKVGVANINSDLATLFRTVVIAVILAAILAVTRQYQPLASISTRTYAFLALSGIATGASWLCYFRALKLGEAARVAPVDKLSVVLVAVFGVAFLSERLTDAGELARRRPDRLRRAARRPQGLSRQTSLCVVSLGNFRSVSGGTGRRGSDDVTVWRCRTRPKTGSYRGRMRTSTR